MAAGRTKVTVAVTSTAIAAANAGREKLTIVNDSDEVIYLAEGVAAVLNEGIRLNPLGGVHVIGPRSRVKGRLFTGAVNGISTTGGKNMTVMEIDGR